MNFVQRQFYALQDQDLPERIPLDDVTYCRTKTFKHDFFAATGLYEHNEDRIVLKIYRYRRFFGLPTGWLGKLQARHEERLYTLLAGIEAVPAFVGMPSPTAFAHVYVPGQPLKRSSRVDDLFFERFGAALGAIHSRGAAYVDLNKSENILLGDDGRPYLIDFQISWAPTTKLPIIRAVAGLILAGFQREDWYHFLKHKRRIRPDLLTESERTLAYKRSLPVRVHRVLSKPYFVIRRFLMNVLKLESVE